MGWVRRTLTGLSVLVVLALCGAWLLFSVPSTGWQALAVPTGSMRPKIAPGSLVFVHRVPVGSLRVGDVITYANPLKPSQSITHRIIKTFWLDGRIPSFVTKGDANSSADVPVVGGAVRGKVVWHLPFAGTVLGWARTWPGLIVLLYVPAFLISLDEVKRLAKYYREQEPYRVPGFVPKLLRREGTISLKPIVLSGLLVVTVVLASLTTGHVLAILHSNTVSLSHNTLSVCRPEGNDDNDVEIGNKTRQSAQSGASTNGTSSDVSNSNKTMVKVKIKSCKADKDHDDKDNGDAGDDDED